MVRKFIERLLKIEPRAPRQCANEIHGREGGSSAVYASKNLDDILKRCVCERDDRDLVLLKGRVEPQRRLIEVAGFELDDAHLLFARRGLAGLQQRETDALTARLLGHEATLQFALVGGGMGERHAAERFAVAPRDKEADIAGTERGRVGQHPRRIDAEGPEYAAPFGGEGTGMTVRIRYEWVPGRRERLAMRSDGPGWWRADIDDRPVGTGEPVRRIDVRLIARADIVVPSLELVAIAEHSRNRALLLVVRVGRRGLRRIGSGLAG